MKIYNYLYNKISKIDFWAKFFANAIKLSKGVFVAIAQSKLYLLPLDAIKFLYSSYKSFTVAASNSSPKDKEIKTYKPSKWSVFFKYLLILIGIGASINTSYYVWSKTLSDVYSNYMLIILLYLITDNIYDFIVCSKTKNKNYKMIGLTTSFMSLLPRCIFISVAFKDTASQFIDNPDLINTFLYYYIVINVLVLILNACRSLFPEPGVVEKKQKNTSKLKSFYLFVYTGLIFCLPVYLVGIFLCELQSFQKMLEYEDEGFKILAYSLSVIITISVISNWFCNVQWLHKKIFACPKSSNMLKGNSQTGPLVKGQAGMSSPRVGPPWSY